MGNYPSKNNRTLFAVDIEIPATVMVRVENRCGRSESPSQRCSFIVTERVGSTEKRTAKRRAK